MKNIIIVFSADAWNTNSSKVFVGVFSSHKKAIKEIKKKNTLSDDLYNLESIKQTQGREMNFILECVNPNEYYEK